MVINIIVSHNKTTIAIIWDKMIKSSMKQWVTVILLMITGISVALAATPQYPPLPQANAVPSTQQQVTVHETGQGPSHQVMTEKELKQKAFENMLQKYFPLTPDQIHQFKNRAAEQQKANALPPGPAPAKGTSAIVTVNLKPGSVMPVVRIGQGMITSLVFIDANGTVWPITSYSIGNSSAFNVSWDKHSGVLMVQGEKLYAQTNVSIMLKGLPIPVMMTLLVGQHDWDFMDYIRINQNQPVGNNNGLSAGPTQAPQYLIALLSGIPPSGAVQLRTSSTMVTAWSYQGHYLILSSGELMSPEWKARVNGPGPNGYHAYTIAPTPLVMVSFNGQLYRITLTEPPVFYKNNGDLQGVATYGQPNVQSQQFVKQINAPKLQPMSGGSSASSQSDTSGGSSLTSRLSNVLHGGG